MVDVKQLENGTTADLSAKISLLEETGFKYDFVREIYFNRQSRKAFSVEAIEDHDERWLRDRINAKIPDEGWSFFFNSPPSKAVQGDLEAILNS